MTSFRLLLAAAFAMLLTQPARADYDFTHNSRSYRLVTTAKSWVNARADATAKGGNLLRLNDAAENAAVLAAINTQNLTSMTRAADGGNARYVWTGGYDRANTLPKPPEANRRFAWVDSNGAVRDFWLGGTTGTAGTDIFGTTLYTNWGRNSAASSQEPDNYSGGGVYQTATGFALDAWPTAQATKIGQPGQWNDIDEDDTLWYVIEFATAPAAPTNLATAPRPDGGLTFSWQDNSSNEEWWIVRISPGAAASWYYVEALASGQNSLLMPNTLLTDNFNNPVPFNPAGTYRFQLLVINDMGETLSSVYTMVMPQRMTNPLGKGGFTGDTINYVPVPSTGGGATVSGFSTGQRPAWMSFVPATGALTGVPDAPGLTTVNVTVNYTGGASFTAPIAFRIEPRPAAPAVVSAPAAQQFATGSTPPPLDVSGVFSDVDSASAIRFDTVKGSFHVILYPTSTPGTVANFLGYANRHDYDGVIVHRSIPGFVIQGGGYRQTTDGGAITDVPEAPHLENEPGHTNLRGTISMAKLGGDPNSATSEWFLSTNNNAANLDFQNGGFTVFGRIATPGLTVLDDLESLKTGTYSYLFPAGLRTFADFPHDLPAAPAGTSVDLAHLVRASTITPVASAPVLSILSNSNPAVCTAVLAGNAITFTPSTSIGGDTVITLRATDLDGNTTDQTIPVQVRDTFAAWAARQNFPQPADATATADPDKDGESNFLEYAWLQDPRAAAPPQWPALTRPDGRLALSFPVRKAGGTALRYTVLGSAALTGPWSPVWSTTDGFANARVASAVDQADRTLVTITDSTLITPGTRRFLRVEITQQ